VPRTRSFRSAGAARRAFLPPVACLAQKLMLLRHSCGQRPPADDGGTNLARDTQGEGIEITESGAWRHASVAGAIWLCRPHGRHSCGNHVRAADWESAIRFALGYRTLVLKSWVAWSVFVRRFNRLELSENTILLSFAVVIGAATALGVVGFYRLIDLAYTAFYEWPGDYLHRPLALAYRPLLTAAGFALAAAIMARLGRGHDGLNVPDVQLAVARYGGVIPARPALARTVASAVTLGSGGSAGSEGPVAVLGSTLGSVLGSGFRFDPARVKVLVAAGAAAGISAAFNAPLAGAFFALEEILGSLAVAAFPAVVVSSVVSAVVSRGFLGNHPAFPIPVEYGYQLTREVFLFYPVLGIVAGLIAVLFIRTYFGMETIAGRLRVPRAALPWIGGALAGALVFASGGMLVGYGHLAVRLEVFGRMSWLILALLVIGKIVATSITLTFGGSGGVFTPSLFIGAAGGGAVGVALVHLFPGLGLSPEPYALVGMGAVVAAATGAPLTGILIVFEMTNDYGIMLPLMLATVIANIVARRLQPDNLYSGWLRRRGEAIEHGSDRGVLTHLRVADALDPNPQVVGEEATVVQLLDQLDRAAQTEFPVIDADRRLVGIVPIGALGRMAQHADTLSRVVVAADLAEDCESIAPDASLLDAMRKLGVRGASVLPVVEPETGRLVGLISRANIISLYERSTAAPVTRPTRRRRRGRRRRDRWRRGLPQSGNDARNKPDAAS
jgi:chloride channel protein, CIC family